MATQQEVAIPLPIPGVDQFGTIGFRSEELPSVYCLNTVVVRQSSYIGSLWFTASDVLEMF